MTWVTWTISVVWVVLFALRRHRGKMPRRSTSVDGTFRSLDGRGGF